MMEALIDVARGGEIMHGHAHLDLVLLQEVRLHMHLQDIIMIQEPVLTHLERWGTFVRNSIVREMPGNAVNVNVMGAKVVLLALVDSSEDVVVALVAVIVVEVTVCVGKLLLHQVAVLGNLDYRKIYKSIKLLENCEEDNIS